MCYIRELATNPARITILYGKEGILELGLLMQLKVKCTLECLLLTGESH
jgi:hypothetical protein